MPPPYSAIIFLLCFLARRITHPCATTAAEALGDYMNKKKIILAGLVATILGIALLLTGCSGPSYFSGKVFALFKGSANGEQLEEYFGMWFIHFYKDGTLKCRPGYEHDTYHMVDQDVYGNFIGPESELVGQPIPVFNGTWTADTATITILIIGETEPVTFNYTIGKYKLVTFTNEADGLSYTYHSDALNNGSDYLQQLIKDGKL